MVLDGGSDLVFRVDAGPSSRCTHGEISLLIRRNLTPHYPNAHPHRNPNTLGVVLASSFRKPHPNTKVLDRNPTHVVILATPLMHSHRKPKSSTGIPRTKSILAHRHRFRTHIRTQAAMVGVCFARASRVGRIPYHVLNVKTKHPLRLQHSATDRITPAPEHSPLFRTAQTVCIQATHRPNPPD
jgi:hypothetical protein